LTFVALKQNGWQPNSAISPKSAMRTAPVLAAVNGAAAAAAVQPVKVLPLFGSVVRICLLQSVSGLPVDILLFPGLCGLLQWHIVSWFAQ
jgi:hypothetical protein